MNHRSIRLHGGRHGLPPGRRWRGRGPLDSLLRTGIGDRGVHGAGTSSAVGQRDNRLVERERQSTAALSGMPNRSVQEGSSCIRAAA